MEVENDSIVDVQAEEIDVCDRESIPEMWYSAAQTQQLLDLTKSSLQKVIVKLQEIGIPLGMLRRGGARATEYSQIALDAINLLNSKKFSELQNLVEKAQTLPSASASTALVALDKHNQIAMTASVAADKNLSEIASLKMGLLSDYRNLGRVLGKQAVSEVRKGFTEEVKAGLVDLRGS